MSDASSDLAGLTPQRYDLWCTAIHEAGHAVAAVAEFVPFRYVTCNPSRKGDSYGHLLFYPRTLRLSYAELVIIKAGLMAEASFRLDHLGTAYEAGTERVLVDQVVLDTGCADFQSLREISETIGHERSERMTLRARAIVIRFWGAIEGVAVEMVTTGRAVTHRKVKEIVGAVKFGEDYVAWMRRQAL